VGDHGVEAGRVDAGQALGRLGRADGGATAPEDENAAATRS
jgi:hypothetical protein